MDKKELIKLAKELVALENLAGREADLLLLKREYRRFAKIEADSFYEQSLIEEFTKIYEELAKKDSTLTASPYDVKKALINHAKELVATGNIKTLNKDMDALFEEFKHTERCSSKEQDDEVWAEIKALRDEAHKKIKEYFEARKVEFDEKKAKKEEIIEEAKKVLEIENFKQAQEKLDALFENWKQVGFSGKENDEKLWQEFNEVRKAFFAKRKEYFANLENVYKERIAKREEIIDKVKQITADAYWTNEEVKTIKNLRNDFKAVGFSGKENDEKLWQEFNEAVDKYFKDYKFYNPGK